MTSPRPLRFLQGQPYLLLTLTTLIWGGNAVAGRLAVGEVSPMALTCLRWVVVVLVLAVVARRGVIAEWPVLRPHLPAVFAMGALGYTTFNAIFYWAAHHTTAINMGVIQGVGPAVVMAGSFAVFGARIRLLQAAGLVATLVGVVVIASRGDPEVLRRLAFNVGDVGIFVATLLYSGYTIALRRRPAVSPLTFFAAMAGAALATSVPLLIWEIATGSVRWPTATGWAITLFVGFMPSLAAQLLFMRGVELIGPNRAGVFMNLVPVFAALLGVAVLGETFAPYHAASLALVLGGIWTVEWGSTSSRSVERKL